ncbi:MAG: Hsp20/alpha crystallin family protein [Deltaproteobacteria bacterium]|nr:Hsp20/alpha crystallin family protein [Deltaproteobacteria bacterium]RKX59260.1 MAG: Hsp20/alpha crystallin family protein [Thermodesulfobacteriota bacterium]MBW1947364.1 Hsp20/alpha crystallin family protein [Deltaproteobacteria bacterium]MBW1966215.1 Hsp20/alpha crystallin family protein [Deltaproteobacteria bacterium]MBW2097238.1 Hsp20/alpha crystallin family protein [Deltaproteobacteria bacterium]
MFEVTPWRPFRELSNLRREMEDLWENIAGEREFLPMRGEWVPALDVSETKDSLIVKAEIPGMEPKDIDISISGDLLTIKGEKKQKTEEKKESFHRIETRYGAFSRTIRVPVAVNSDKIDASYDKGVLKIVLPKKEEIKAKQIEIKQG